MMKFSFCVLENSAQAWIGSRFCLYARNQFNFFFVLGRGGLHVRIGVVGVYIFWGYCEQFQNNECTEQ